MANICTIYHNTSFFMTHKETDGFTLTTEVSMFDASPFGRVYDDSCDIGFNLKSEWTDKIVTFVVNKIDERGGDILAWNLVPVGKDKNLPVKVVVFND
jgi:hypothetical protein